MFSVVLVLVHYEVEQDGRSLLVGDAFSSSDDVTHFAFTTSNAIESLFNDKPRKSLTPAFLSLFPH